MSLINTARKTEAYASGNEAISISTNGTFYSQAINMEGVQTLMYTVGMGTAAGGIEDTVQLFQAESATKARSSAASTLSAAFTLGNPGTTGILLARKVSITVTTAATDNQIFINSVGLTQSTIGGAATATTSFGSTIDSSGAGALDAITNSLASKINASTDPALVGLTASTISTAAIEIVVNDTASTTVNVQSTAAAFLAALIHQEKRIEIPAYALDSTSKYVSVHLTSAATAVLMSVSHVKDGYYKPAVNHGFLAQIKPT
jgi:hypothetical protein